MFKGADSESSSIASGPPRNLSRCASSAEDSEAALGSRGTSRISMTTNSFPEALVPRKATIWPGKKLQERTLSIFRGTLKPIPVRLDVSSTSEAALSFPSGESEAIRPTATTSVRLELLIHPRRRRAGQAFWCIQLPLNGTPTRSAPIQLGPRSRRAGNKPIQHPKDISALCRTSLRVGDLPLRLDLHFPIAIFELVLYALLEVTKRLKTQVLSIYIELYAV
ncbi:hypothetical protein HG530_003150 [Fusarium avenaceum]|nr:hypothetical protein HG530_003150 [Fusarium avenaceum]